ncbi:dihydroneopterin aldolase [Francisellaceae bacterium CB300]|jgi:dihydroneopterin aldolase
MQQSLYLQNMQIFVSLGCSEEERANKQLIEIDLELLFPKNFNASDTDDLDETICYYTLRNKIQAFCDDISCNLIEYLAKQIYSFINENYAISVKYLKLIKRPPMSQIESASFIIRG